MSHIPTYVNRSHYSVLQSRGFQIITTGNSYIKINTDIITICLKYKSRYLMQDISSIKSTIPAHYTFQMGTSQSLPQIAGTALQYRFCTLTILLADLDTHGSHSMLVAVKGNVSCTLSRASYTELGIQPVTLRHIVLL